MHTTADGNVHITCNTCSENFYLEPREQNWFKDRNYLLPKRCQPCRKRKRKLYAEAVEGTHSDSVGGNIAFEQKCINCGGIFNISPSNARGCMGSGNRASARKGQSSSGVRQARVRRARGVFRAPSRYV